MLMKCETCLHFTICLKYDVSSLTLLLINDDRNNNAAIRRAPSAPTTHVTSA